MTSQRRSVAPLTPASVHDRATHDRPQQPVTIQHSPRTIRQETTMSTYHIKASTVTPLPGGGYVHDVFTAPMTQRDVEVTNAAELRNALAALAVEHYDKDPDNTPAVVALAWIARGSRNVAGFKSASRFAAKAPTLAEGSAAKKAAIAAVAPTLPLDTGSTIAAVTDRGTVVIAETRRVDA